MNRSVILFVGAIAAAGCGRSKQPEPGPNPTRGLRSLTPDSVVVTSIALSAARSLPPSGQKTTFAGVFVNGRRAPQASSTIIRTLGFVDGTEMGGKVPFVVSCRSGPCPAGSGPSGMPTSYTFAEIRATADSAYVGYTAMAGGDAKAACITLKRVDDAWVVLSTAAIAQARNCGR